MTASSSIRKRGEGYFTGSSPLYASPATNHESEKPRYRRKIHDPLRDSRFVSMSFFRKSESSGRDCKEEGLVGKEKEEGLTLISNNQGVGMPCDYGEKVEEARFVEGKDGNGESSHDWKEKEEGKDGNGESSHEKPELVKDSVEEWIKPLTEDEESEVTIAFDTPNRRKYVVAHKNSNIDITGSKFACLKPMRWLNDKVINVYLALLKERENREPNKFLKCHFFNTFFYTKLISGKASYNFQSVQSWTKSEKLGYSLSECDKIFVPIHQRNHWCLAVINNKEQKFQYLDSLKGADSQVLDALKRYYVEEVMDKCKRNIDVSSWKLEFVSDLPQQTNGYDGGVFMVKFADFCSRDVGLRFTQDNMPYFRRRIAKELLKLRAE